MTAFAAASFAQLVNRQVALAEGEGRSLLALEPVTPINDAAAFATLTVNLADTDLATGRVLRHQGWGLIYKRENSAPGGRLDLEIGGRVSAFMPGSQLLGRFSGFVLKRNSRSSAVGSAELLILERPDAWFKEPVGIELPVQPVDLLGSSTTPTFVTVTTGVDPSGAAPAGSFDVTGWKRLRIFIDVGAGVDSAFRVIPWIREPNSALWFEQGTEYVDVDAGMTTADYRYRVVTFALTGAPGRFYLQHNAAADIGMMVQGIE